MFARPSIVCVALRLARGTALLALFSCACCNPNAARSADDAAGDPVKAQVQEFVDAGEFGPAIALARTAPTAQRDQALATIARGQASGGSLKSSYYTLAEVNDGRVRTQALADVKKAPLAAQGGGANFGPLIQMIEDTIAPDSWDTNSGVGSIKPFMNGVYVDTEGVMRRTPKQKDKGALADLRRDAMHEMVSDDVRQSSELRKVSLSRLEREIQIRLAAGQPLDEEMLVLAGLKRVQYVLVYPESGEIVLAGPASDWKNNPEQRIVSVEDGAPILRLDDLLVLMRRRAETRQANFGCSIDPTEKGLASAQEYIKTQGNAPLKAGQVGKHYEEIRNRIGLQDAVFFGVDPQSRVAQVLLEADQHMKLIGIGLEPGTKGVPSYLSMIQMKPGEPAPALDVLRWWFTTNYDAIVASDAGDAFEIRGQGVKVLSENELLTDQGKQVHTGKSDPLNEKFAANFTKEFPALAEKYPVYAELRNVFDLALVVSLLEADDLANQANWHPTFFLDAVSFPTATENVPKFVETVMNRRVINRTQLIGVVSGGVSVNTASLVDRSKMAKDSERKLDGQRKASIHKSDAERSWWWD